ncbi:hypothetical protein IY145_05970 [Methylosinus sp. H3A]|uniref:hypothetical protein n=1 Tax=Methylosinus sp. H3A TaxID=2785786 RepID=UPI0018C28379|nr:hypothetical protein [Methylosinus sp. H3A]MBG0808918.1 hypothetical protein [Methylosinus sp. H3A]
MKRSIFASLALALCCAGAAHAQPQAAGQSDWPCRQVKVQSVAVAGVWTGPSIDGATSWRDDAALGDLVARISARRTPIETAQKLVGDFATAAGDKRKERLTALFAGVYDTLEAERHAVLAGLDRYGAKQKQLADRLREETQTLRAEQDKASQDKASQDAQKLKDASEALQWDLRVFDERRHALSYVCETPALIEQRLGALARVIEAAID